MSHDKHVTDGYNQDVGYRSWQEAKDYYLELAATWTDPYPDPVVTVHDGVRCVRDDLITGTKVRGGDCLMSRINQSTIVYVQPRTGLAGVSILDVAKRYDKKVKLFMPSAQRISHHQAWCIDQGAEASFHRIAAMPNLNKIAKEWADQNDDAFFVPLGLKHELVTAGIVKAASKIPAPDEVYVAISTGVLSRAMQIAWPNAKFHSVAVSRNLKAGELGRADVISEPMAFQQSEKPENLPPFPCIDTYDGKVWKYIPKNTGRNILFWNVGKEPTLNDPTIYDRVNSYRDWPKNDVQFATLDV
jgi:hypothetical protein